MVRTPEETASEPNDTREAYMMSRGRSTTLAALVGLAACATSSEARRRGGREDSDTITRAELSTVAGTTQNAFSAVERLRPLFLVTRPGSEILRGETSRVHVFINGNFAGDIEVLNTIPLGNVEWIQRVRATPPFTQFGGQMGDEVVLVRVR